MRCVIQQDAGLDNLGSLWQATTTREAKPFNVCLGLARTIHTRCIYGIFGRGKICGHRRCIYTILAKPFDVCWRLHFACPRFFSFLAEFAWHMGPTTSTVRSFIPQSPFVPAHYAVGKTKLTRWRVIMLQADPSRDKTLTHRQEQQTVCWLKTLLPLITNAMK